MNGHCYLPDAWYTITGCSLIHNRQ